MVNIDPALQSAGWQDVIRRHSGFESSPRDHRYAPIEAIPPVYVAELPDDLIDPSIAHPYDSRVNRSVRYDPVTTEVTDVDSNAMPGDKRRGEDDFQQSRLTKVLGIIAADYAAFAETDPDQPLVIGDLDFREGLITSKIVGRERWVHTDSSMLPPFVGYLGVVGSGTICFPGTYPDGYHDIDPLDAPNSVTLESDSLYRYDTMLPHVEPPYLLTIPNTYRAFLRARIWLEDQL